MNKKETAKNVTNVTRNRQKERIVAKKGTAENYN